MSAVKESRRNDLPDVAGDGDDLPLTIGGVSRLTGLSPDYTDRDVVCVRRGLPINAFFEFVTNHQWVIVAFALWGFIDAAMKGSESLAREFVAWTHRMRLYWRRFRSEPRPQ